MSEPKTCYSRWFSIAAMVGSAVTAGVAIANAYYYHKLARSELTPDVVLPVSHNEMWALFWLNIIVAVFALIIFIWSIYHLIKCNQRDEYVECDVGSSGTCYPISSSPRSLRASSRSAYPTRQI
jgi:heme/copper-type cytochrome/quinol oxidase subunit 2